MNEKGLGVFVLVTYALDVLYLWVISGGVHRIAQFYDWRDYSMLFDLGAMFLIALSISWFMGAWSSKTETGIRAVVAIFLFVIPVTASVGFTLFLCVGGLCG